MGLNLVESDSLLKPYASAIEARCKYASELETTLTSGMELSQWADGYLYFGLHHLPNGWVLREFCPNATAVYVKGDMNGWQKNEDFRLKHIGNGVWELYFAENQISHAQLYRLLVEWSGGWGERIPSYATRVVQDNNTKVFSAQVWNPSDTIERRKFAGLKKGSSLFIYECHIGMSGESEEISTFESFRIDVLPRIHKLGYNCIQLMAIQEHPYYGSFGYHVSNFFAVSSRFGTPEDLKRLIEDAHNMGMMVIMDLVHSHSVKNEREGLALLDGTPYLYFHDGPRRKHPAWDSLCFDYSKHNVLHFLLSNCKFWLEVYNFDGFRFDGVTSMMYLSHGLGEDFEGYDKYYDANEDGDAIAYLTLANKLVHQLKPYAVTIAEDMSGMPGLAYPIEDGGMGFDYRLAMGIPDFWIKYIKEVRDEDWKAGHIYYEMTNRRHDEKTISYVESHDQALVGDKTVIFRLVDSDMYWHFEHGHSTYMVDRGIALHKMIRLITASTANGGYLNFMGNEFGHPEWIDFPRDGNNGSYKYARRQWSLADNPNFYYRDLNRFDQCMVQMLKDNMKPHHGRMGMSLPECVKLWDREADQVMAFRRGKLIFVFNWNGSKSFLNYGIPVPQGKYQVLLNTDAVDFAGFGLSDDSVNHFTTTDTAFFKKKKVGWLKLYIPARSAVVLKLMD